MFLIVNLIGFFFNFIIMFIVYCIESPTIDDQSFDLRDSKSSVNKSLSMNFYEK